VFGFAKAKLVFDPINEGSSLPDEQTKISRSLPSVGNWYPPTLPVTQSGAARPSDFLGLPAQRAVMHFRRVKLCQSM
jgi:hypothetical protein